MLVARPTGVGLPSPPRGRVPAETTTYLVDTSCSQSPGNSCSGTFGYRYKLRVTGRYRIQPSQHSGPVAGRKKEISMPHNPQSGIGESQGTMAYHNSTRVLVDSFCCRGYTLSLKFPFIKLDILNIREFKLREFKLREPNLLFKTTETTTRKAEHDLRYTMIHSSRLIYNLLSFLRENPDCDAERLRSKRTTSNSKEHRTTTT